jgi:hypothetical protein
MKSDVNWTVVFLFIVGFLFFILSFSAEHNLDKVMDLFISGFYFIYAFSSAIESKIEQTKKEIMDELKKLK